MLEDRLLVWRFNRGDVAAVRRIYQKYKNDLVTLAGILLNDVSTAEDVVHDVFVAFIKLAGRFRLTGSLKGYLATCVANSARNRNKARLQRISSLDEAQQVASDMPNPDHSAIFGEQMGQLSMALTQLPYEQREVVLLRHSTGMKFKVLEISINTAQGRYRYGMDKLRSMLNSEVQK
ncbi:MAG: RNA polymerase sigma factor [Planctomycetota bacterium]